MGQSKFFHRGMNAVASEQFKSSATLPLNSGTWVLLPISGEKTSGHPSTNQTQVHRTDDLNEKEKKIATEYANPKVQPNRTK
jgi:hypothetical protein